MARDPGGVRGARRSQMLYPGMKLVLDSVDAERCRIACSLAWLSDSVEDHTRRDRVSEAAHP